MFCMWELISLVWDILWSYNFSYNWNTFSAVRWRSIEHSFVHIFLAVEQLANFKYTLENIPNLINIQESAFFWSHASICSCNSLLFRVPGVTAGLFSIPVTTLNTFFDWNAIFKWYNQTEKWSPLKTLTPNFFLFSFCISKRKELEKEGAVLFISRLIINSGKQECKN